MRTLVSKGRGGGRAWIPAPRRFSDEEIPTCAHTTAAPRDSALTFWVGTHY